MANTEQSTLTIATLLKYRPEYVNKQENAKSKDEDCIKQIKGKEMKTPNSQPRTPKASSPKRMKDKDFFDPDQKPNK